MRSLQVILQTCGDGETANQQVRTLGAVVVNLHTGGSIKMVAFHWTEATVESGSLLSDQEALFRTALLASVAQGRG